MDDISVQVKSKVAQAGEAVTKASQRMKYAKRGFRHIAATMPASFVK